MIEALLFVAVGMIIAAAIYQLRSLGARHVDRYDAYLALLSVPDGPELCDVNGVSLRGRKYVQPGMHHKDQIKRDLHRAYVGHRMQDAGRETASIVSVRRSLRLLKRA